MNIQLICGTPDKYLHVMEQLTAKDWSVQFCTFASALSKSREADNDIILLDMTNSLNARALSLRFSSQIRKGLLQLRRFLKNYGWTKSLHQKQQFECT